MEIAINWSCLKQFSCLVCKETFLVEETKKPKYCPYCNHTYLTTDHRFVIINEFQKLNENVPL